MWRRRQNIFVQSLSMDQWQMTWSCMTVEAAEHTRSSCFGHLSSVNKRQCLLTTRASWLFPTCFTLYRCWRGVGWVLTHPQHYWCVRSMKYRQKFLLLLSLMACWYVEMQSTILVFGFKQVEATTSLLNHQLFIIAHAGTIVEYHYLLKPLCIIFSFTVQSSSTLIHSIKWL